MTAQISFFPPVSTKKGEHTAIKEMTIHDFLSGIKTGLWQRETEAIRAVLTKKERDVLKKKLPSVTVSGTFTGRKEMGLQKHSGFLCIDIDNYTNKEKLITDPYAYAVFFSVSGGGLAMVFKITPEKHKESFLWIQEYLNNTYGVIVDPAPQNVASIRYVSYDPEIFINEKSKKCGIRVWQKKIPKGIPLILGTTELDTLVQQAVSQGVNFTENYFEWLYVSFALVDGFGEGGRNAFHTLSSVSAKYDPEACDRQYDIAMRREDYGGPKITISTLYGYIKKSGVMLPTTNNHAMHTAIVKKHMGKTQEEIQQELIQEEGVENLVAQRIVESAFTRGDLDPQQMSYSIGEIVDPAITFIHTKFQPRKNKVTGRYFFGKKEATDALASDVQLAGQKFFNSKYFTDSLVEKIIKSSHTPLFDPIQEFVDECIAEGYTKEKCYNNDYIAELADSIVSSTPSYHLFIHKWMISLIASWKGQQARCFLFICGGQELGKSHFFQHLLPPGLKEDFFGENNLADNKDVDKLMCEKLIIMDDEMIGKGAQKEERFKSLCSKDTFYFRPPYGKRNETFKKLAVLCGTGNDTNVISDFTGNTRIWPIKIEERNREKYDAVDKKGLFMEAYWRFMDGEKHVLTKEESKLLTQNSTIFTKDFVEEQLVLMYIEPSETETLFFAEIKMHIQDLTGYSIKSDKTLGAACRKLLGEPTSVRFNNKIVKKYKAKRIGKHSFLV